MNVSISVSNYVVEYDPASTCFTTASKVQYSEPTDLQVPLFMGKIIQMFDVFNIRFGATLVGPTGAGKTTCYRMLAAVMTDLRNKGSVNPEFQVTLLRRRFAFTLPLVSLLYFDTIHRGDHLSIYLLKTPFTLNLVDRWPCGCTK